MPYKKPLNILFVCTGNSCRSQMAEGYARAIGDGLLSADSAGIEAHGKNMLAVRVMQEDGVDISQQQSKRLNKAQLDVADIVITVCGHADEHCPVLPPTTIRCHWPFDDPARLKGDESIVIEGFRTVRNQIKKRIEEFVAGLESEQIRRAS